MFRIVLTLLLFGLTHFFVDVMLSIWPLYKTLIGLNLATAGLIAAIGALIGETTEVFFGIWSDRGYRKSIIIFGLILATTNGFLGIFTNAFMLFILYLFTCIGSGAIHPSAAGLVTTVIPARRGLLMAIFAAGGSLGLGLGQLIFAKIYTAFPEHSYLITIPPLLLALVLLLFKFPETTLPDAAHRLKIKDLVGFFKSKPLRMLYIALVANQSIFWGMIFILPDALKTLGHGDWVCYGGGHMCMILGGAITMIPAGYLSDRYTAKRVMLIATVIAAGIFYGLLFTGGISISYVAFFLFGVGACLAVVHPIGVALGSRFVPDHPSTISAFLMGIVWCVSEVIGPGGVGALSVLFSDYAPVKALAVLGSLFIVNLFAILALPQEEGALELA